VKKLIILPKALDDWQGAAEYYQAQSLTVGHRFEIELDEAFAWITRSSSTWVQVAPGLQKCQLRKFPYSVLYRLTADAVLITAIIHQKRHPDSWRKR
jgi:plasmid stabilization system protein ParE